MRPLASNHAEGILSNLLVGTGPQPMDEFELVSTFFSEQAVHRNDVIQGIGDDAAVLQAPPQQQLVLTTDTLIAGVHFPSDAPVAAIGHKALAVSLSDLAAMGAQPAWASLCLSLPEGDPEWLRAFCRGFFDLANAFQVQLVGGDTTQGPLTISVQLIGFVPDNKALTRGGARAGDGIFVTGVLGDAAVALRLQQGQLELDSQAQDSFRQKLHRPWPRVDVGLALRNLASAAIDISDGLTADLTHLLRTSQVGARIELTQLPLSKEYRQHALPLVAWEPAASGGDDYELCFTVAAGNERAALQAIRDLKVTCTRIGSIEDAPGLRVTDEDGGQWQPQRGGYVHFQESGP